MPLVAQIDFMSKNVEILKHWNLRGALLRTPKAEEGTSFTCRQQRVYAQSEHLYLSLVHGDL